MIRSVKMGFAKLKPTMIGTLVVGLVFLASGQSFINSVYAAAGEGTATIQIGTGGTSASDATYTAASAAGTVTVGQKSYVRLNLTVGASGVASSEDNVTIKINNNLFPTNGWNTGKEAFLADLNAVGEWFVDYTDTDSITTDNAAISFTASAASNSGLITIQANQQMDATDVLTIYGVVQDNNYDLDGDFLIIQTDDTGADNLSSIGTSPLIATTYADAQATLTLGANSVVGVAGTLTLNITLPFALDPDDTIGMTFDDSFDISNVGAAVTGTLENGNEITCADLGIRISCTVISGPTATSGTIIMTGVTTKHASTANVDVGAENEGVGADYIAVSLNPPTTDITAADAEATVTLASPAIGGIGNTTVALTSPFALDSADTIDITFPDHIDVSNVGAAVTGTLENGNEITCADVGQVVTCTVISGPTQATGTIILTGLTALASGTTNASLQIEDEGVSSYDIATDSTVAMTDTPVGAITNTSLFLSSYQVNIDGSMTANMTLANGLPDDGKILITFAGGFDLGSVNVVDSDTNIDGTYSLSHAGNVVTIERNGDGAVVPDATAISLTFSTVGNPTIAGPTDVFTFQTTTNNDLVIDQDVNVTGLTINALNEPVNTGGGGGGGGVGQVSDTTSNTQTTMTVNKINTIEGTVSYSGPIELNSSNITVDAQNDTAVGMLTGQKGNLTLKPNKNSTISILFPPNTQVTSAAKWSGLIQPPLVKSLNLISVEGDKIQGSMDLLKRADVLVVAQVGTNVPLKFSQKFTLMIPVSAPNGSMVEVYTSEDADLWLAMGTATVENGYVKLISDHLSYFALKATEATKELIEAQNLTGFTDIKGHWAEAYIKTLVEMKIVNGKTPTTFSPDDAITRAELVKIATKAFNIPIDPSVSASTFSDVSTNDWFITFVNAARKAGIVEGVGNNLFAPNVAVDRAAGLKIMLKAAGFDQVAPKALFNDVGVKDWFAGYVTFASENGVVEGYGNGIFGPERKITRAEASKIIVKLMEMKK